MIENIDRLISVLRKSNNKALNPGELTERLSRKASLPVVEVRACLLELRKRGWISSADWDDRGIPLAKLAVQLPPEPLKSHEVRWSEALQAAHLTEKEIDVLISIANAIKEMPAAEMSALIDGLKRLRDDMPSRAGERLYDVSSRYLVGSSKMLKVLPNRILIEFGINVDLLSGPPRYVKIAGSIKPKGTILVENPHAFESAVQADINQDFCWISAEGYGLSKQGEEFGDQLTSMVSNRRGVITLSRREMFIEFQSALELGKVRLFFWGDLDLAGLDIYGRLKTCLPTIRLCPLYKPMIEMLKSGEGHSYVGVQKERQILGSFPYPEVSELSSLCAYRGLDQESVVLSDLLLSSLNWN